MIVSSDIEYQRIKLIKKGEKRIDKKNKSLAIWISEKYDVNVLDIQEHFMNHNKKIIITIYLETYQEIMKFKSDNDCRYNFDTIRQNEIAEKYIQNGNFLKVPANGILGKVIKRNPKVNDIFVSFSAFEPIAKEEVIRLIPENRLEQIYLGMKLPEVWTISRCFDSVTLFVYKDKQKDKVKKSDEFKLIEEKCFELLKEYDEFNYWKREDFGIGIDSKQNFDNNYQSNWYYYYK